MFAQLTQFWIAVEMLGVLRAFQMGSKRGYWQAAEAVNSGATGLARIRFREAAKRPLGEALTASSAAFHRPGTGESPVPWRSFNLPGGRF